MNWQALAVRCRTLQETVDAARSIAFDASDPAHEGEAALAEWRRALDPLAPDLLTERLQSAGVDAGTVLAVRDRGLPGAEPPWLGEAIRVWPLLSEPPPTARLFGPQELPFSELFEALSQHEVDRALAAAGGPVTASLRQGLGRQLLAQLQRVALRVLASEWAIHNAMQVNVGARGGRTPGFAGFCERLRAGLWDKVRDEYPMLARLLATVTGHWQRNTVELLQRVVADREAIAGHFGWTGGPAWTGVSGGLSDPHLGGRSVLILHFEGDRRVVYKPRPLSTECFFLEWWRSAGAAAAPDFGGLPLVLEREGYGYVDFVHAGADLDAQGRGAWGRAAGRLLWHAWMLGLSDLHFENIVATPRGPVPVDLETLCCGRPRRTGNQGALGELQHAFYFDSVVRTALLPNFVVDPVGNVSDLGGLSGGPGGEGSQTVKVRQWQAVNTDEMRESVVSLPMPLPTNRPRVDGASVDASTLTPDILEGWRSAAQAVSDEAVRQRLLALCEPLQDLPTRFILRNTKIYASLIQKSLLPAHLRSGWDFGLVFEPLWRALRLAGDAQEKREMAGIVPEEIAAVTGLDIPYLHTRPGASHAEIGGARLSLNECAVDLVRGRIRAGGPLAEQQTGVIRHLLSTAGRSLADQQRAEAVPRAAVAAPGEGAFGDRARRFVDRTAQQVLAEALRSGEDQAWWLGMTFNDTAWRWQYGPIPARLYDGVLGTLVFLAWYGRLRDEAPVRRLVAGTTRALLEDLAFATTTRIVRDWGSGLLTGAASLPLGLRWIGRALEDEHLTRESGRLALEIAAAALHRPSDDDLDLMKGRVGALGMLAHLSRDESGLLPTGALRQAMGELREPLAAQLRQRLAARPARLPMGYAHGLSGVASALLASCEAGPDPGILALAQSALGAEDECFDEAAANWPDWRDFGQGDRARYTGGWCGGASGFGIARLQAARMASDGRWRAPARRAMRAVCHCEETVDHVCCGEAGALSFLGLALGQGLEEPQAQAQRQRRWERLLDRAEGPSGLRMGLSHALVAPTLYQGHSGVALQLLGLEDPAQVPDLAGWLGMPG